ncbi:conserved hypothetical protein [gamma proteobacterium HTCC5015]|nr:conserved hypothetical protein [gamma proteobacterium HTCC5015]
MQFLKVVTFGVASALFFAGSVQAADSEWKPNTQAYFAAGDDRSYFGLAGLIPFYQDGKRLGYADLRYSSSDVDTDEINLGAGFRSLNENETAIYGFYGSYDLRKSATERDYRQLTFGAELLTDTWDYRSNFYFPTGDDSYQVGNAEDDVTVESEFVGHDLVRTTTTVGGGTIFEEALSGADIEVGRLLNFDNFEMRGYLGAYHFSADVIGGTTGTRARLEMRPLKNFNLNFVIEDDDLYRTRGLMEFRWAFGWDATPGGVRSLHERMTQFVYRDIDIRETSRIEAEKRTVNDGEVTVEVDTPIEKIAHIDNSSSAGGDGTAERPYQTIAECQAAGANTVGCSSSANVTETIFVHTGESVLLDENNQPLEDQSAAVVYEGSIDLKEKQLLVGDGAKVDGNVFELVTTGIAPIIGFDSASGNNYVIKAGNQAEVFGVQVGTTDSNVSWTATDTAILVEDVSSFNAQRVFINSDRANGRIFDKGVHFVASAGQTLLRNTLDDVGINGANTGILIEATGAGNATSGFTEQRLSFENVTTAGGNIGVNMKALAGGAVKQELFWAENTREDNAFQNIIQNNARQGLLVEGPGTGAAADMTDQDVELRNVSIFSNGQAGIEMELENVIDGEDSTLELKQTNILGNEGGGIWFKTDGGVGALVLEETQVIANIANPGTNTAPAPQAGLGIVMEAESTTRDTTQSLSILGEERDDDDEVTREASVIYGHGVGRPQIYFDAAVPGAGLTVEQQLVIQDTADIRDTAAVFVQDDGSFVLEQRLNSTHPQVNVCESGTGAGTVVQPSNAPQGISVVENCL